VELGVVLFIGIEVIRGEHDGLAGKAVTKGVDGYPAPAFCSYGAGGKGGVLAVDFGAIDGFGTIHNKNLGLFVARRKGYLVDKSRCY
jgi:hypothetical protein